MRSSPAIALLIVWLSLLLPAGPAAADPGYDQARLDYFALRADKARNGLRHHWMDVIGRLDRGVAKIGKGARRCDALFNAGRAWHEMSDVSYLWSDREEAIKRYTRLVEACPTSNLADDALFHTAELQARRDGAVARRTWEKQLSRYPKGDLAPQARERLAQLGGPAKSDQAERLAAERVAAEKAAASRRAEEEATRRREAERLAAERLAAEKAAAARRAEEEATRKREAERLAAVRPAADNALANDEPGASLPSAADILAALDAEGADATRAADLALDEDLRRDALLDRGQLAKIEAATGGEIPLSLAAGLKVRRVVIDPGHGGKDTGAIGKNGTREKDLTLEISKKLKKRLVAMGLEVFLTRETDVFLELEERTRFANEKRADLFISVHVNAAKNRNAKGIETYTLNLNSDRYAMRLAARENASSSKSIGELQFILADLATKANTDDSVRLARLVQGEMVGRLRQKWGKEIKDLGVKQALFYVLVGAKMPAILVETAFVSNLEEEKRLRNPAYQDETARAIADGVRRFIDDREAIARGGDGGGGVF